MHVNEQAKQLFNKQVNDWPLAAAHYAALAQVEVKKLSVHGFDFFVQFNRGRIISSTANIDPQTIKERKCFLCIPHLPPQQEFMPYRCKTGHEYAVLCNPYPIFPRHLTIPDVNHRAQIMLGRIEDMLELAEQLSDFVLFYNGPQCGASAPDHFHFQAGNKGFLPLQAFIESGLPIKNYPLPLFVYESEEAESVAFTFDLYVTAFQKILPQTPEPMFNLLCWKTGKMFYLVIFPRKGHRPRQFFEEGDARILLSPGAIDLSGIVVTPQEKDFRKLSEADLSDIFSQIGISPADYRQLADSLYIK
jgi:hypothetical protein